MYEFVMLIWFRKTSVLFIVSIYVLLRHVSISCSTSIDIKRMNMILETCFTSRKLTAEQSGIVARHYFLDSGSRNDCLVPRRVLVYIINLQPSIQYSACSPFL